VVKNNQHAERAKIFMPFDALKGFKEALKEKEKIVVPRIYLSEEAKDILIAKLDKLQKGMMIKITYYFDNQYLEFKGIVSKIDTLNKYIMIVKEKVLVEDIYAIEFLDEEYNYLND